MAALWHGSWGVIGIHFGVITRPKMRESREEGKRRAQGGRLAERGEGNKECNEIVPHGRSVQTLFVTQTSVTVTQ